MKKNYASLEPLEARIAPATLVVTNLKDSGDGSLRATLGEAAAGDVIHFANGLQGILNLNSTLDITAGITIAAAQPGSITLSGQNTVQILNVDDGDDTTMSNVKLVNLRFINGAATAAGGAILDVENLTASGCTFFGNHVTAGDGGAISVLGDGATLQLLNSKFLGNSASGDGGAVDFSASSGNLISNGTLFKGNHAAQGGAIAVSDVPTVQIISSKILQNTATQLGGGVYFSNVATAVFTTATVADNVVTGTASTTGGGGIALSGSGLKLLGTTLSANTAGGSGGGLLVDADSQANLQASTLSGNLAQWGGGIDFAGDLKLNASRIAGNLATKSGGGIYGEAGEQNLNIIGGAITGNQATGATGGGLDLLNGGYQIIQHALISGNTAGTSGGGLAATNGNLNVAGTTFAKNGAGIGGGVYLFTSTSPLTTHFATCIFSGNSAVTNGGGIYLASTALSMKTSTLAGNNATNGGGGLYVDGGASAIINSTYFQQNRADNGGGVYFLGQVNLGTSVLAKNVAASNGGGVYGAAGALDFLIANSTINGNKAKADNGTGGGFCLLGSGQSSLYTCQIIGNKAGGNGGGIAAANGVVKVIASTIAANSATFGGGVSLFKGTVNASANFTDSTVTGNKAVTIGGGIYSSTSTAQVLSGTQVFGNSAPANADLFGTYLQS
jgi:predicted outer membrane repeat protein